MSQTTYIIKPVTTDVGNTYKWRASYMESNAIGNGYSAVTDVDFLFDTEEEAAQFTRALLEKAGVKNEQIVNEEESVSL